MCYRAGLGKLAIPFTAPLAAALRSLGGLSTLVRFYEDFVEIQKMLNASSNFMLDTCKNKVRKRKGKKKERKEKEKGKKEEKKKGK